MSAQPTIRVADYIMEYLARHGSDQAFLLPGGGAMHLVDAAGRCEPMSIVCMHHEQAVGIAAEAWARVTGRPAVAIVTTGPGATNVITGVAGAWIESVPLIVVSGQVKRPDRMRGAPLRQKGVQEVDVVPMIRPITKYAVTVEEPTEIRRHLDMALHFAREGRQGPVWIDVPLDVQGAPVDPSALEGWSPPERPRSDPTAAVDATLALLASASRPLLLAGHGVRLAGAASHFAALVDALGIPVATTWNALDLLPHEHPALVGRPGAVAVRAPNFAVQNCDALIAVGARLDNVVTAYNPSQFARHAKKIIVDVDPNELARHELPDSTTFAVDARDYLEALRARLDAPFVRPDWTARCRQWKARWTRLDGQAFPTEGKIGHSHVTDALAEAVPEDTLVVTGSSGLAVEAFYLGFRNRPGQRVFLTSGLGAMGYGLPAAIGAGVAHGRRFVLVESDGSMQLNVQELATIAALRLPVVIVLLDNAGYASIRNTQRGYFEGRYVGTGPESGLVFPDWLALARAYGIEAMNVADVSELSSGLAKALAHPGPLLCRVELVHDELLWPRVASKPQRDGSMLTMPLEDMTPLLPIEALQQEMVVPLAEASYKAREG